MAPLSDISRLRLALALFCVVLAPSAALARLAPKDYRNIGVSVPPGATLPRNVVVTEVGGRERRLAELVTRPSVLVFADYKCRDLCGPVLDFVTHALGGSGLRAGDQFGMVVIGLDPKDSAADAATMRSAHIERGTALDGATTFVTADQATVATLTKALGYRFAYDAEAQAYVHPAAAYVLAADGRVARVLTGLGLSATDMRLALVEAADGKIGTISDRIRLLCSHFDPAHGQYNLLVSRLLAISGAVTVIALGGGIVLLALAGRRGAA
jgi:protein SCO1/2